MKASGKRGAKMQRTTNEQASPVDAVDEELIDTLIAISVVAKRLAHKLRAEQETQNNEKKEEHQSE